MWNVEKTKISFIYNRRKISLMEVKFYDNVEDELLKFAVIISKSSGKWVHYNFLLNPSVFTQ